MSISPEISFSRSTRQAGGLAVILRDEEGRQSAGAASADPENVVARAAKVAEFRGDARSALDIVAPAGSPADRIAVLGIGKEADRNPQFWVQLGGRIAAAAKSVRRVTVWLDLDEGKAKPEDVAAVAQGILLRSYRFDRYKTRKDDQPRDQVRYTLVASAATTARRNFEDAQAVAAGVCLARDLVNEPANVLGPAEFANRARELGNLGVRVEILTERDMGRIGMGALLGVAQGSARPPRLVVMQWLGGKAKEKPVAFVGKGVVFDTGGISIKPANGMEDMKGDMAGAAAVVGLMHALAARKARVNAVGIVALVENMPDGNAQRPGDIVTSLSGQTIEVINTDAEGRLVLADALWYCNDRFEPRFMIDLATLTGAIMVALGKQHAGLFSNDDTLARQLFEAGQATQERVWRMPLGPDYDKMIDSKVADMKNVGGRNGGAITAAQFLQRFVRTTPWAHLDIAGTGMDSGEDDINRSWGSGFGVRLLDRLVRDHYER